MKHVSILLVSVLVVSSACEPEATPVDEGATLTATVFTPAGQVDCSTGCSIDLGEIEVGATRETPLIFESDGPVVISDVVSDGCEGFSIRIPGPFENRSTTSIRLVAADAGTCASTFSFVSNAANIDAIVIDVSAVVAAPPG